MNTSLAETINNLRYQSLPRNIIMDEEIPLAPTLTTLTKEIQPKCQNFDDYISSLKDQIGLFKSEIIFLRHELTEKNNITKFFPPQDHAHPFSISNKTDTN